MGRPYGAEFIRELTANTDDTKVGVELARLCVKGGLPATHVARALGVTRTTVYCWFRGQGVREKKLRDVEQLIKFIEEGFKNGDLPVTTTDESQEFFEHYIGIEV